MKRWYEGKGAKEYRKANKRVQKALMNAKEDWIDNQCTEIDVCLNKNNSNKSISAGKGSNFREAG